MDSIVSDGADGLYKADSDIYGHSLFGFGLGGGDRVDGLLVVDCLFAQILQFIYQTINSLLSLFTLCHLSSHSFLGQASWLTKDFAKTFFGRQLLDTVTVFAHELLARILL